MGIDGRGDCRIHCVIAHVHTLNVIAATVILRTTNNKDFGFIFFTLIAGVEQIKPCIIENGDQSILCLVVVRVYLDMCCWMFLCRHLWLCYCSFQLQLLYANLYLLVAFLVCVTVLLALISSFLFYICFTLRSYLIPI